MHLINLRKLKNKYVLSVQDNSGNVVRNITLMEGSGYILNPLNIRYDKDRARKVIFKSVEQTRYGPIAKIKYLDTLRPGRVPVDYLDNVHAEIQAKKEPVEDIIEPFVYNDYLPLFQLYLDILNVLDYKKDQANIVHITQHQIAELVNTSPTNVSKRLKQLIRYGAIESISPGVYKLIHNSIWHTPYRTVHRVISLVSEQPELIKLYKEQAKVLNVSLDDISQAWSFLNQIRD